MKRILVSILIELVVLSSGCAQDHAHLQWTDATVTGLAMSLDDSDTFEELRFAKDGNLAITAGKKDGPYASPASHWSVVNGKLQFGEGNNFKQFALVSRDASTVVVTDNTGKTLTFKILR